VAEEVKGQVAARAVAAVAEVPEAAAVKAAGVRAVAVEVQVEAVVKAEAVRAEAGEDRAVAAVRVDRAEGTAVGQVGEEIGSARQLAGALNARQLLLSPF
jgi:hypothetical protein